MTIDFDDEVPASVINWVSFGVKLLPGATDSRMTVSLLKRAERIALAGQADLIIAPGAEVESLVKAPTSGSARDPRSYDNSAEDGAFWM